VLGTDADDHTAAATAVARLEAADEARDPSAIGRFTSVTASTPSA
jgi:hypothetical protein